MPHGDGAHTHGPSGHGFDWRIAAVVAVVALLASGEATRAVVSGIEALILWLAVVFGVAVMTAVAVVVVAVKRRTPDYVRAVHGVTARDQFADERAQIQRDAASYRAMRTEIETRILTQQAWEKLTARDPHYDGAVVHVGRAADGDYARYADIETDSGPRGGE